MAEPARAGRQALSMKSPLQGIGPRGSVTQRDGDARLAAPATARHRPRGTCAPPSSATVSLHAGRDDLDACHRRIDDAEQRPTADRCRRCRRNARRPLAAGPSAGSAQLPDATAPVSCTTPSASAGPNASPSVRPATMQRRELSPSKMRTAHGGPPCGSATGAPVCTLPDGSSSRRRRRLLGRRARGDDARAWRCRRRSPAPPRRRSTAAASPTPVRGLVHVLVEVRHEGEVSGAVTFGVGAVVT